MIRLSIYTTLLGTMLLTSGCNIEIFGGLNRAPGQDETRLTRALDHNAENPHALLLRGRNALETGNPSEALKSFDKALTLQPNFEEAKEGRGLAYLDMERYGKAADAFIAMAAEFPESIAAKEGLAVALFLQGRFDDAKSAAEEAVAMDPDSAQGHRILGEVAYAKADYTGALDHWEAASKLDNSQRAELRLLMDDLRLYTQKYAAE